MASKKKAKRGTKPRFTIAEFACDVFRGRFMVVIGEDAHLSGDACMKWFGETDRKALKPFLDTVAEVGVGNNMAKFVYVRRPDGSGFPAIFCRRRESVIHECVHAATWLLNDRGIPISYENDESLAYLTDFLCKKCYEVADIHDMKFGK